MTNIGDIANILLATGPWGIVAVLGWAFWRKEIEIRDLYEQIVKLSTEQIGAINRMENALSSLKESIITAMLRIQ